MIFDWQHLIEHLDQRDLGAEGIEEIGELSANRTSADNHDGLRLRLHLQRLARGHDAHTVDFEVGQLTWLTTSGNEGILSNQDLTLIWTVSDLYHPRDCDRADPLNVIDLILLKQKLDTFGHRARYVA